MKAWLPALGATLAVAAAAPNEHGDVATRWVMGTSLTIDVPGAAESEAAAAARDEAFEEARRWDDLLSNWRSDTPLARLNASAGKGRIEVAPGLFAYIARAVHDTKRTNGLFDITVGALFARGRSADGTPDGLSQALACTGAHRVRLDAPNHVALPAGMALDPGGDGKGVALDAMVAQLRRCGIASAFLDFGGSSFYGLGSARDGKRWKVALRGPDGEIVGAVQLADASLSASAALRTAAEGEVQAHIVDPRTGTLVRAPRSAFAISPSATDAEVLSTALIVSPDDGPEILPRFDRAEAAVIEVGRPRWATEHFPWEAVDEVSCESP